MNKLTGKVTVDTGASNRSGASITKALAAVSASVAVFLTSDDSGWMIGEHLVVSGGLR